VSRANRGTSEDARACTHEYTSLTRWFTDGMIVRRAAAPGSAAFFSAAATSILRSKKGSHAGKTKSGKFMSEADAKAAGYKAAQKE